MEEAESQAAAVLQQLATDPRFSLVPAPPLRFLRAAARLLMRTRLPWHLLLALLSPRAGRERLLRLERALRDAGKVEASASCADRLAAVEQLFFDTSVRLLSTASSAMVAGMEAFAQACTLLGDLASVGERQGVLRARPSNPTTDMTLALWALSQHVHADPATPALVRNTPPARLPQDSRHRNLPPLL